MKSTKIISSVFIIYYFEFVIFATTSQYLSIAKYCTKRDYEYDCRDFNPAKQNVSVLNLSNMLHHLTNDERDTILKVNFAFNQIVSIEKEKSAERSYENHVIDLNLNNNHIHKFGDRPFENFYFLRKLDLNCNNIVEIKEYIFYNLSLLIQIDLSDNLLDKFDMNAFKHLPSLKRLDLSGNPKLFQKNIILDFTPDLLPKLEVLKLKNCGLLNMNMINFSPSLIIDSLSINMNLFEKLPNEKLANLKNLKSLDISANNMIYSLSKEDFKSLATVEMLTITGMGKLKRIKDYTFSGLIKLRELVCSYNPVLREVSERAFTILPNDKSPEAKETKQKYLPELEIIALSNNLIARLNKNIFDTKKLLKIDVSNNPLRCNSNLNFLFELTNTKVLLNQLQTNCSFPAKFARRSFYELRASGLENFVTDRFLDEEHQALFGLLCVIMISFLVVCLICILKTFRLRENLQKSAHRYYQCSGFKNGCWNCFNCCGLVKTKGFYDNFNIENVRYEIDRDQELELPN